MNTYFYHIKHLNTLTSISTQSGTFSTPEGGVDAYKDFCNQVLTNFSNEHGVFKSKIIVVSFNKI